MWFKVYNLSECVLQFHVLNALKNPILALLKIIVSRAKSLITGNN